MSLSSPNWKYFAKVVIACEKSGIRPSDAKVPAGCRAIDKLRPHLATLVGNVGCNALIQRARALGSKDVPWMAAISPSMQTSLDEFNEIGSQLKSDEFGEGCLFLLSHLLGLLATFIGQAITLRLVREVWPELSLDDLVDDKGNKNEKRK